MAHSKEKRRGVVIRKIQQVEVLKTLLRKIRLQEARDGPMNVPIERNAAALILSPTYHSTELFFAGYILGSIIVEHGAY